MILLKTLTGAGELAWRLRAPPALTEDPGQFPVPHDGLQTSITPAPGHQTPSSGLHGQA